MDVFTAIETRRAVKHFEPGENMTNEEINKLLSATILSPTSYNIQHWRFVRISDSLLREQIKEAAWGQSQVTDAAELIVLCADTDAWQTNPERYFSETDEQTRTTLLDMLDSFYRDNKQRQYDETLRSCGIAAQSLMLAAKAMGYDTCPMIGFDQEKVGQLIQLPDGHIISMMITIGKARQPAHPRSGQLPLAEVFIEDRF
ncbi:nitroreductase family protein [Endozoicomonas sp. OPT23]|uniref:nitroreductase family protein n=1 Tax=Endozoicomonas sp. OPT23 TaxID=2072845 RepID=UPI00129AEB07|nr:nitroreductase family protein [Endozoicomonas sp. OPT23]MRI34745.1 nitroreductase family protein [Endozoicomonas sp. OPT23]